ncbi:metabotropic glutamate receptor 3 isoform X2 [Nematostella vectensis]|nr:metabotropic glutamate receptor 3 isoform X2 [Nematostella vectensis]XP_032238526.2 metabotropic glutamate receptor 3 isoform X2 [Nematostella vectensis]
MPRAMNTYMLLVITLSYITNQANGKEDKNLLMKGDILLGGLVPVHSKNVDLQCGELQERLGIQRLEALLYALDKINAANSTLLNGITLGLQLYDTCSSETMALDKSLNFIYSQLKSESTSSRVVGIIGAAYSSVSIQIARLSRLFEIPQISYDSTSFELSDKKRFGFFSRTVPHDNFQAKALVDVLKYFNWTYVSVVYSDDSYGILGVDALRSAATRAGICMASSHKVRSSCHESTYLLVVDSILSEPLARTVIVFAQVHQIRGLLHAVQVRNAADQLQFVGSDAWGNVVWLKDLQSVALNTITVSPKSVRLKGFEEYFTSLSPINNSRNPWFQEYWEHHFNCSLNETLGKYPTKCNDSLKLSLGNSDIDMRIASAIDAVYAFAHALEAMHADLCRYTVGVCPAMENISGSELLGYIRNASFVGATGEKVHFDANGDVEGIYDVMRFEKSSGTYRNVIIGTWKDKLRMRNEHKFEIVKSSCSDECSSDEVMLPVRGKEACCWSCEPCKGNSYVINRTTCLTCPLGSWPNHSADRKQCLQIELQYFGKNLMYAVPAMGFAGTGIFITIFVVYLLAKHDKTPIVKACGRELAYLLLVSILLCFSDTFIVVLRPTRIICIARFFLSSLGFTISYAAIFIKTNRISRIFNRRNVAKRPILVLPSSQLVLVLGVVCVQALFLVLLTLLRTPTARHFYPTVDTVYLSCSTSDLDFGLSQVYNFILIIMCTVYAFKTRKIPSNFNEAKLIAFAMYSSCVIWLAFLAVYFMQRSLVERPLILSISISLIAYVLLGSLYGPKVYILIFRPHRNVRRPHHGSLSVSSLNQSNPKCSKCAGYVGMNLSADRQISDDAYASDSNRLSLIEAARPQSYADSHDDKQQISYKQDLEKHLVHIKKELQATKHALKVANDKLRRKDLPPCEEKQPLNRDRRVDNDDVHRINAVTRHDIIDANNRTLACHDNPTAGENKTQPANKQPQTETHNTGPALVTDYLDREFHNTAFNIPKTRRAVSTQGIITLGEQECQFCHLRKSYENSDHHQSQGRDKRPRKRAMDSGFVEFNNGLLCEHCGGACGDGSRQVPKGTLSLWRRSRSLSDLENKLNSVLYLAKHARKKGSSTNSVDKGSVENHKHSYAAMPELDETLVRNTEI